MIRVLIADDHAIIREGLKKIIAKTSDIVVADEAKNAQEVLEKVRTNNYDVVLLDIKMPGRSGLDILEEVKSELPKLPFLILSIFPESQYAVRALRIGASGYMTKSSAPSELIEAIRKVSRGRKYISSSLAEKLAFDLETDSKKAPHETLSNREYQVMCMLAIGKTVIEIATELSLSTKTISTYRARVLEKLKMKNNAELAHYATRNKLVP